MRSGTEHIGTPAANQLLRILVGFGFVRAGRSVVLLGAVARVFAHQPTEFTTEFIVERRPVRRVARALAAPTRQVALAATFVFILVLSQCSTPPRLELAAARI